MRRMVLCLVLWFFVASSGYASTKNDIDARAFLEEIVGSDFAGDASPRIGHILQRERRSIKQSTANGPAYEIYDLDSDPLVVVKDWKFLAMEGSASSKVCGKFRFTVVATTVGKGIPSWMSTKSRHIVALPEATAHTLAYCAKLIKGTWMLIDPPAPRVSKARLLDFMKERSSHAQKIALEVSNADPRAVTNAQRILKSIDEQLAVLLHL